MTVFPDSIVFVSSQKLGALSEEIQRRQKIIDEQLAELKEITGRLTPEEQKVLLEVIKEKDADNQENTMQVLPSSQPEQNTGPMLSSVTFLSSARCCAEGLFIIPMNNWVLLITVKELLLNAPLQHAV